MRGVRGGGGRGVHSAGLGLRQGLRMRVMLMLMRLLMTLALTLRMRLQMHIADLHRRRRVRIPHLRVLAVAVVYWVIKGTDERNPSTSIVSASAAA